MSDTLWHTLKSSALTVVEGSGGGVGMEGGGVVGGGSGAGAGAGTVSMTSAENLLNSQLASALMGSNDAKYLEDSISPSTARQQLTSSDPSNPNSTPSLLKAMKWLLACVSKGRDVSDFFPNVVKLVACPSLEVRKMVYVYLQHYANYNAACRELALLSINAFQQGLADSEQWIRALALRVLTCIHVPDVLQIQVLAVQTCSRDTSPYVRKCAANALAKLHPRCDPSSQELLLEILRQLLEEDESSSMVLSSVMYSFLELCPERLDLLHRAYRKLCNWLVDMDDSGQVVLLDILSRYCRRFFQQPEVTAFSQSAQLIDRQRRVRRPTLFSHPPDHSSLDDNITTNSTNNNNNNNSNNNNSTVNNNNNNRRMITKVKRRVVRKAFYSDEEDESSEEEVNVCAETGQPIASSLATAMRQDQVLGFGDGVAGVDMMGSHRNSLSDAASQFGHLHKDHALLLKSSLPLLRSRNSAVVMAVASLHYYCGIPSIAVRSSIGKALVRIYHDKREIQYVVLTSIQMLVQECPSAFTPYLQDFFVKGMDPSFTRMIKLDILTFLALEPNSIHTVLTELRTYIRHFDKTFVAASVQAVGKIVELARTVHDRHGIKVGNTNQARHDANLIALNCLHGLCTITSSSDDTLVLGECLRTMQHILLLLLSTHPSTQEPPPVTVQDPNQVIPAAMRRMLLFVIRSFHQSSSDEETKIEDQHPNDNDKEDEQDYNSLDTMTKIKNKIILLPPETIAPALWILGEWLTQRNHHGKVQLFPKCHKRDLQQIRLNLLRMQAKSFCDLTSNPLKLQCIHFATKSWLCSHGQQQQQQEQQQEQQALAEFILGCGRVDVHVDVRDRARFESALLHHTANGLMYDKDHLSPDTTSRKFTLQQTKDIILQYKPPSSWLPLDDNNADYDNHKFRFGTLSSLVSHKAGNAYCSLPPWAKQDSPTSLRDPPARVQPTNNTNRRNVMGVTNVSNDDFYEGDNDDHSSSSEYTSSSSDDDSSSSEEEDSNDTGSYEDDSSSSYDDSSSDNYDTSSSHRAPAAPVPTTTSNTVKVGSLVPISNANPTSFNNNNNIATNIMMSSNQAQPTSLSSEDDSSSESSYETDDSSITTTMTEQVTKETLLQLPTKTDPTSTMMSNDSLLAPLPQTTTTVTRSSSNMSTLAEGLEGLVMTPLVMDKDESNNACDIESESSYWKQQVRPELSGGLHVESRFLRGLNREREAKHMKLDPNNPAVFCLQVKLENRRTDGSLLRRIRFIQRAVSGSRANSVHRIIFPQEVGQLKQNKKCLLMLGIEFTDMSEKDGSLVTKFDIKSDRGSISIVIKPPLGEMLVPCKISKDQFDKTVEKMHGIHQRTTYSFSLQKLSGNSLSEKRRGLLKNLKQRAYLSQVGNKKGWSSDDNFCRLVAQLPLSGLHVCVQVKCCDKTDTGEILVCCDSTMALNSIMELLKHAVSPK